MYIRLGEMKKEKKESLLKLMTKRKYKKKTVIKDRDLNVTILIPISSEEELREEVLAPAPAKEAEFKKEKVLELYLLEPTTKSPTEISFNINKDITIPARTAPFNYVFPIKYFPKHFTKITSLKIERDIHPTLVTISNIVKEIQKNIPLIKLGKPELIKIFNIEKSVNIKVTPSIKALNYVVHPRLIFRRPYRIGQKKVNKEIMVKTSKSLSFTSSAGLMPKGTLIEQEDILKYFLGVTLSKMIMDRPFLILAEKPQKKLFEYIEFLKRLLRELYRVYVGGLPGPLDLRTKFEEVKLDVRAGKHICVIDVDKVFGKDIESNIVKYVMDRLRELYSQGLGFLIFYGSKESLNNIRKTLWHLRVFKDKYFTYSLGGKVPQPIWVNIWEDSKVYNLANLVWGRIDNFEHIPKENVDLDSYVVMLEEEFYRRITELASDPYMIIKVEPSKRDEEKLGGETLLHYGTKAFVVKCLIEQEKIPDINILTEYKINDIVLDIFVKHPKYGDLSIEVETLYGTSLPLLKLRKTIESRLSKGLKLWIVIPNPQFMLFFGDLAKLRSIYKEKYLDSIEFFTIDIYSQKLIPFIKVMEKIKQLMGT